MCGNARSVGSISNESDHNLSQHDFWVAFMVSLSEFRRDMAEMDRHFRPHIVCRILSIFSPRLRELTRESDPRTKDLYKTIDSLIASMTPSEIATPETIDLARARRIARGSGHRVRDVRGLIKSCREWPAIKAQIEQLKRETQRSLPSIVGVVLVLCLLSVASVLILVWLLSSQ